MTQTNRIQLFDGWAAHYDPAATSGEDDFPFAGYELILDEVVSLADVRPGMRVLDLGIGTGNLAARFVGRGCLVWGLDFSGKMLAHAHARLRQVYLVQADLLDEWPLSLEQRFDRVVSSYVFHEFDLETKVSLLQRAARHFLLPGGRILIADIAFPTRSARAEAARRLAACWDEDEAYWAADETVARCEQAGLPAAYKQLSICGGVFVFATQAKEVVRGD
jgi:ubiquinone/menaquinone biosynthesis C-methylase UbiE